MEGIEPILTNETTPFDLSVRPQLAGEDVLFGNFTPAPAVGMSSSIVPLSEINQSEEEFAPHILLNTVFISNGNNTIKASNPDTDTLIGITTYQPLVSDLNGDGITDSHQILLEQFNIKFQSGIELSSSPHPPISLSPHPSDLLSGNGTQSNPTFNSGTFTVGETGRVNIDFLFDGGAYRGEVAIFSLEGMDVFTPGSHQFIQEAARRALTNSELGYVVISDQTEGARFTGELGETDNCNSGLYPGFKTFNMTPGDEFGIMLVPNDRVQKVFNNPSRGGAAHPLFSLVTANPNQAFHVGQIADLTGDCSVFALEDLRVDDWSDRDYNDIIFRVTGATGTAVSIGEVINPHRNWTSTDEGKAFLDKIANHPPNLAFSTDSNYEFGETINITGVVSDSDGNSDIARVEFWQRQENGDWQFIGNETDFTPEGNTNQVSFDYSLPNLAPGNYDVRAIAFDEAGELSNTVIQHFTVDSPNIPPELLQFGTQSFYTLNETISVLGGRVFDANGVNDIAKVDFWLEPKGGNPIDISDAVSFQVDSDGWGTFNYELTGLAPGRYTLRAIAYDQDNTSSNEFSQSFTVLSAQTDGFSDRVKYAIERAINLNSYTTAELAATQQWVVSIQAGASAQALATSIGAENLGATGHIPNTFTWKFPAGFDIGDITGQMAALSGVEFFYPLIPIQPKPAHGTIAPEVDTIPNLSVPVTGKGVVIGIIDDGLQYSHPALQNAYRPDLSSDFNEIINGNYDTDPTPLPSQLEGTAIGAIATGNGTGVAPDADLVGLRLTADIIQDTQIADAVSYRNQDIDIYNNSVEDSYWLDLPQSEFELETGANRGRDGLGSIFVVGAGNQGESLLNANYNPFANSRHAIAVAGLNENGIQAQDSEKGSPILVSAYANLTGYQGDAGSTDTAAAFVTGVAALILEANPTLTWRDVQYILVQTAQQNDPSDSDWTTNGAGYHINHKYGFGIIDPAAAVNLAKNWTTLAPEVVAREKNGFPLGKLIEDENGVADAIAFLEDVTVESVEVMFDATHQFQGDLKIVLTSPSGTKSILAEPHIELSEQSNGWLFTSKRYWGESSLGEWQLEVFDEVGNNLTGTWKSWQLNVFGTQNLQTVTIESTQPNATEGGRDGEFTVKRVGGTTGDLEVHYSIAGTAANGTDYQGLNGVVIIPDGVNSINIDLKTLDDTLPEWSETVQLSLQSSNSYQLGGNISAIATITDNELPLVTLNTTDANVGEANNPGQMRVTRLGGNLNEDLTINLNLDGTATNGQDYQFLNNTVTIPAGQTEAIININPLDDTEVEWDETVTVNLVSGNYNIGTVNNGTVTLVENEQPLVNLIVTDGDAAEINNPGLFQVTRFGGNPTVPLSINYTLGGTGTNGQDYNPLSGTVTIPANAITATIPITPILDDKVEGDETVEVNLAANSTYQVGNNSSGLVTIADVEVPGPHSATNLNQTHTYIEDIPLQLTPIIITDPDGQSTVTITLTNPAAGKLVSGTKESLNGIWQSPINASVQEVNALLANLRFIPTPDLNGNLTAAITVTDDISVPLTGTITLNGLPVNDLPTVTPIAEFSGAVQNNPFTITYDALLQVTQTEDIDNDAISFQIESIQSGELTKNGQPLGLEDLVSLGEELNWTPDTFGNDILAFTLRAFDGTGMSTLVQVKVNVIQQSKFQWQETWPEPGAGGPGPGVAYEARDVAFDSQGNIYMAGWNRDPGGTLEAGYGAFLLKYDATGNFQWTQQIPFLNTPNYDDSIGVAVDSQDRVYLTGTTRGVLGQTNYGGADTWLAQYDGNGDQLWLEQFGSSVDDFATGITIDQQNNIYISGTTSGQLGNSYFGGKDAFIAKYNSSGQSIGNPIQFGTVADDESAGVAVDSAGNIYLSGTTSGQLGNNGQLGNINFGGKDTFLAKFNSNNQFQWAKQLGTSADDVAAGVAVDGTGNVLVTGTTGGLLPNNTTAGGEDAFVAKYNSSGQQQWIEQLGTSSNDSATDVDVNRETGDVYISVNSPGNLGDEPGIAPTWLVGYDRNGNQKLTQRLTAGNISSENTVAGLAVRGKIDGNSNQVEVALTGDYSSQVWVELYNINSWYSNNQLGFTFPTTLSYTEDTSLNLNAIASPTAGIAVNDPDVGDVISVNLQLSNPTGGSLTTGTANATASTFNPNTGLWQVSGEVDDVNTLLTNLQFIPTANFNGNLTIDVQATDNIPNPDTGIVTPLAGIINLIGTPVDDVPTATNLNQILSYTEDTPRQLQPIVVSDVDGQTTVTLTLNPQLGQLLSGNISSNSNGVWQIGGTVAEVNAILANLQFQPNPNVNGNITINANVSHPTAPATGIITLIGSQVNDPPTLTAVATLNGATQNQPFEITYTDLVNGANEGDIDSNLVFFQVDSVLSGTLTKNGVAVTPGTILTTGEKLVWISSQVGSQIPAFSIIATDGNANSSLPVEVKINTGNPTIVSISATDPNASEIGDSGEFTITRSGNISQDLIVNYGIGGTATNGNDYDPLTGMVVIPAGQNSVVIPVQPHSDQVLEGNETVMLNLIANPGYGLSNDSATVTIEDRVNVWTKQLGTSGYEDAKAVTVDSQGNLYMTGRTSGNLAGTNQGIFDAWVAKCDSSGNEIWRQQLGSSQYESGTSIAIDSVGNVYVTGFTEGNIDGETGVSDRDAWVAMYNNQGVKQWTEQLRSPNSDYANGIAVDNTGNVYLTGRTDGDLGGVNLGGSDAWLAKYNPQIQEWQKVQLGTGAADEANGIAIDQSTGNLYITGTTSGNLDGTNAGFTDAWIAKYDPSLDLKWQKQLGTPSEDEGKAIAINGNGRIFITGNTKGNLAGAGSHQGNIDTWVAEYDSNGILLQRQQLGTSSLDAVASIAADSGGNVYITGRTAGSLDGTNQGSFDSWVAKYDSNFNLQWRKQRGTTGEDAANGVAVDRVGYVYLVGDTAGNLAGINQGGSDAWIDKLLG